MLTGLFVPLITPMTADGAIAVASLETLAHEVLDAGAAGLVALGTTGEPATLDAAERRAVTDVCARVCRERSVPLVVGAGSNDTAASVVAVRELAAWPEVVAALVAVPYYTLPSEEGVVAHLSRLANQSSIPLVVYHVPRRTGRLLSAATMLRLAGIPGIVGVKYAAGTLDADTGHVLAGSPPEFAVLAGDDALAPALLALGAAGAIMASAHVSTQDYATLVDDWRAGEVGRARATGHRLAALSTALFAEPNPTVIKGVLYTQGRIPSPAVRLPLLPASEATVTAAVAAALASGRAAVGSGSARSERGGTGVAKTAV
jgi:4-hydroxy-tetrahydrodipicolinate synthase